MGFSHARSQTWSRPQGWQIEQQPRIAPGLLVFANRQNALSGALCRGGSCGWMWCASSGGSGAVRAKPCCGALWSCGVRTAALSSHGAFHASSRDGDHDWCGVLECCSQFRAPFGCGWCAAHGAFDRVHQCLHLLPHLRQHPVREYSRQRVRRPAHLRLGHERPPRGCCGHVDRGSAAEPKR